MKVNSIALALLCYLNGVTSQRALQCFVPGECLDSQILGTTLTNTSRECWNHCQNVTSCTWFTFYKDSKICTHLSGCLRLSNEKCQDNCISGEEECPEVQCGVQGRCYGALEGIRKVGSAKECGTICESHQECFWNTYDPHHESCLMTNDCPLLDLSCGNCSTSERNCFVKRGTTEIASASKNKFNLLGTDLMLGGYFINMKTSTGIQCPPFGFGGFIVSNCQHTTIENQLHICCDGYEEMATDMVCLKFDFETKTMIETDTVIIEDADFLDFVNLPNGNIFFMVKSKEAYLYDGYKIEIVSSTFPYSDSTFLTPFCRTAISEHEILIGFAPEKMQNGKWNVSTEMYSFNVRDGKAEMMKIEVPNLRLMNSLCEAFGQQGNRKVAIFGGKHLMDDKPGGAFEGTLILDWNSKTFDMHGPSLQEANPNQNHVQSVAYGDTFLFYTHNNNETKIYKFDINGTETKIPFVGRVPRACLNLTPILFDESICK